MIGLLLLAACGPRWTEPGVVAPTLVRMDTDKSGAVEKGEYDAVLYRGLPFEKADADADGKGDACDACPADPNPGSAGCPLSSTRWTCPGRNFRAWHSGSRCSRHYCTT
jgi:hypothetical protein